METHRHEIKDVISLQRILDEKSDKGHTHEGYAPTGHKHSEYALSEHYHSEYAPKKHTHTGFAPKNHEHDGYAAKKHEHPELMEQIANAGGKVIIAAAQGIDPTTVAEDKVQTFILTHTGKKPKHLYDFFSGAHFNTANSIIAPGKTFACRIIRHGSDLYVLFDGILTD